MIHMCILECKRKRCCHFTTHMDMPRGSFGSIAWFSSLHKTRVHQINHIICLGKHTSLKLLQDFPGLPNSPQTKMELYGILMVFLKRYGWQRWRSLEILDCPTSFRPSLHPRHPYSGATSTSAEISGPWEFEIITTQLGKFHVKSLLTSIILGKVVHPIPSILNPWKLTWNLKSGKIIWFETFIFGVPYLNFRGAKSRSMVFFLVHPKLSGLDPSERCDWKIDLLGIFQGGVRCDRTTCATCTHVFLHSELLLVR